MGGFQIKQPVLLKEAVWPTLMVFPATPAASSVAFAQDAAQTHADPPVEILKDRLIAMSEIREPAT
jgi:hypothetical protein